MASKVGLTSGAVVYVEEDTERINNLMTWHHEFLDFQLWSPYEDKKRTPIRIRKSQIVYYYETTPGIG